jgi:hypothetical protein
MASNQQQKPLDGTEDRKTTLPPALAAYPPLRVLSLGLLAPICVEFEAE